MSTKSRAKRVSSQEIVSQGDVFKNVKYNYIDIEDDDDIQIVEMEFPLAIVLSQDCDVISMSKLIQNRSGAASKFMPSILMCPIYYEDEIRTSNHIADVINEFQISIDDGRMYHKEDRVTAEKDWHYRFHSLEIECGNKSVAKKCVIDFKHYFCVPISYLLKNRNNRLCKLDSIYSEQIVLKFANFLSRVPMPE